MSPSWHVASRVRPRRYAVTISPTADAVATIGRSAMSGTPLAAPCSCGCTGDVSGKRAAGKWTDAATGAHGDLLDIIRESRGLREFREVAEEARRFLRLPHTEPELVTKPARPAAPVGSQEAARRLFAISGPIEGTIVETYLQRRGILHVHHGGSLRFLRAAIIGLTSTCRPKPGRR